MTNKRQAWIVMLVTFMASIAVAINQFKIPPVMQVLMAELNIGMVLGGWLMSIVSVAAIVLAVPSALLLTRLGPKITGLVALGCTVIGAILGALAHGAGTLLFARLIEGVGMGLIAVIAPAIISMWFEPKERGLPMGIWAAWVPIGNVIIFNLAHPLLEAFGWRSLWWFGALVGFLALVAFGLVVNAPPHLETGKERTPEAKNSFGKTLLNPSSWLLAAAFGAFSFSLIGYNTWAPSFLSQTFGIADATASFYASLMFLAAIPSNVTAGWLLNRTRGGALVLISSFVVTGILFFWTFRLESVAVVVPYMIALGFASNFIPTSVFTLAPETVPDLRLAGLALAIVGIGSGLGGLTGPPILGAILSGGNWTVSSMGLVIVMFFGTMASILAARRIKKA